MTRTAKLAISLSLAAPIAAYVVVVFGGYAPVAATGAHSRVVEWTLQTARRNTILRHAASITPPNLDGGETIRLGAQAYAEMCVACHAGPGKDADDGLVRGLNPPPPELAKVAANRSPAELYWATKYGIRMTGMPAWGPTHSESHLWALVAFMKAMPSMPPADYERLASPAEYDSAVTAPVAPAPHSHHADEHSHHH